MIAGNKIHEGNNVKRIREIVGINQKTLGFDLNMSQSNISLLEQKESIDPSLLLEISKSLKVPVEFIKKYNEEHVMNINSKMLNEVSFLNTSDTSSSNVNPRVTLIQLKKRLAFMK